MEHRLITIATEKYSRAIVLKSFWSQMVSSVQ